MLIPLTRPARSVVAGGFAVAAVAAAATVLPSVPALASEGGCPETGGTWIREEAATGQDLSMTVAAPSLMLIVETCVSAGDTVVYATYSPGEVNVTVASPMGAGDQQPISHVSYRVEMAPETPGSCLPELAPCPPGETPVPTPSEPAASPAPVVTPTPVVTPASAAPAPTRSTVARPRVAPVAPVAPADVPVATAAVAPADAAGPGAAGVAPRDTATDSSSTARAVTYQAVTVPTATVISAEGRMLAVDETAPAAGPAALSAAFGALLLGLGAAATVTRRRHAVAS